MKLNDYQTQALSTAIYPLERALDYTVLGLCSEVAEYYTAPDIYELGDCAWYWAAGLDAIGLKPTELMSADTKPTVYSSDWPLGGLIAVSGAIAGVTKKAIRDDEGRLTTEKKARLAQLYAEFYWALVDEAQERGWLVGAVFTKNLDKLASRNARGVLGGSGDHR